VTHAFYRRNEYIDAITLQGGLQFICFGKSFCKSKRNKNFRLRIHCFGCGNDYIFHDGLNKFHRWVYDKHKSLDPVIHVDLYDLDGAFYIWKSENKGLF
jgi:hypothetical protein